MPEKNKVKINGEAVWNSPNIKSLKSEFRAEYCWLRPLGGPKGVFRADPNFIWCKAYGFNRPEVSRELVAEILKEFVQADLLHIVDGVGYWLPFGSSNDVIRKSLLEKQGGVCALCRSDDPKAKGWQLDHNHETLRIRGVLCSKCNRGLGMFRDSPELLSKARDYLLSEFKEDHGPIWSE